MTGDSSVGEPLTLAWNSHWPDGTACESPHYLLFAVPEATRLGAYGALALAPGELGPDGLAWRQDDLRIVVPLGPGWPKSGSVPVLPFALGEYSVDWTLIEAGPTPKIAAGGRLEAQVSPAAPMLIVQDPFATETPDQVIRSVRGTHLLEVFDGHYRVRHATTGALVIEAEGENPAFSPTGRFVHGFPTDRPAGKVTDATHWLPADLVIHDVLSETEVVALRTGGTASRGQFITGLLWSPGDSFLTIMFEANSALAVKAMLTDGPTSAIDPSCGGCSPWDEAYVEVSLAEGLAYFGVPNAYVAMPLFADPAGSLDELHTIEPIATPWINLLGAPQASYLMDAAPYSDEELVFPYRLAKHPELSRDVPIPKPEVSDTIARGAVALPGEPEAAPSRIEERLASFGLTAAPTLQTAADVVPSDWSVWYDTLPGGSDAPEPTDWLLPGGYYFQPGKAAVAAGLATEQQAADLTRQSLKLMEAGFCVAHRNHELAVWSWSPEPGVVRQLLHFHCRVSTGYEPEGTLWLVSVGDEVAGPIQLAASRPGYDDEEATEDSEWVDWKIVDLPGVAAHGPLRVDRLGPDELAITGLNGNITLFDAGALETQALVAAVPAPGQVTRLGLTPEGHLLQVQTDGQFHLHGLDGMRLLDGFYLDDEVVVFDPATRFDATPEGAGFVGARFTGDPDVYSLEQLGARLQVPGLVAATVSGAPLTPLPPLESLPPQVFANWLEDGSGLMVRAKAPGRLERVDIFRDGAPLLRLPLSGETTSLEVPIATLPETRWIAVRVVDAAGLTSRVVSLPTKPQKANPAGRLVVLSVGVDEFSDPRLQNLSFAESDATRFADGVRTRGLDRHRSVSLDLLPPESDLREALPDKLRRLSRELGPEDTLMIFLASHGVAEGDRFYLAQGNSRVDDLPGTALELSDLAKSMAGISARVLIFVDACHAGGAGTNDAAFAALSGEGAAFAVIAASKGRQPSLESAALGGGAFTSALLRALSGDAADFDGNGTMELVELYAVLKRDVVNATKGRQTPWIARTGFVGEVPVF